MDWVLVGEFKEAGRDLEVERSRWLDVAEDMGLIPERNVRVLTEDGAYKVEISIEMHDCLRGPF